MYCSAEVDTPSAPKRSSPAKSSISRMDRRAGRSMWRMMRSPQRSGRASSIAPGAVLLSPVLKTWPWTMGMSSLSAKFHQSAV